MTSPTIQELKEIIEGATAGPWKINSKYSGEVRIEGVNGRPVVSLGDDGACGDPECCGPAEYYIEIDEEDCEFISVSRSALPAALRVIEELKQALSEAIYDDCDEKGHAAMQSVAAFERGEY